MENVERNPEPQRLPRSIFFIVSNELCERFNYYGMRTILALYLTLKLGYDDDSATVLYHSSAMLVYFMCIGGAIVSDSWLGKYRTILYLSLVYVGGSVLIALGAIPPLNLDARATTMIGLLLIGIGSGGIKPCVAAFGGEQLQEPGQERLQEIFFSIFYFAINLGSFVSTLITPIMRADVQCFGQEDCFSLAFGVPGVLMVISVVIFVVGKPMYRITAPAGNMLVRVSKCIWTAIRNRWNDNGQNPQEHFLDHAVETWGQQLVDETKILLNVLRLYIPLPLFWALFDQQGSRWTFQATHMDGDLGFWTIKPDQMQVINPVLILVFVPLFEVAIYPLLSLLRIRRPLQKLTLGGIFAGVAFLISAMVENQLENTYVVLPKAGESQIRIFNGLNCDYGVQSNLTYHANFALKARDLFEDKYVPVKGQQYFTYNFTSTTNTSKCGIPIEDHLRIEERKQMSYFINDRNNGNASIMTFEDNTEKSSNGNPMVRVLGSTIVNRTYVFRDVGSSKPFDSHTSDTYNSEIFESFPSEYQILVEGKLVLNYTLRIGGVYTFIIGEDNLTEYWIHPIVVTEPNSISMLWLLPQYVVMTLAEVMFSITGLEFAFTQAPESMKSILQGCWLLTVAFGNLIVVLVAEARFFQAQKWEFLLFAVLMFVDMVIFALLAYYYRPIPLEQYRNDRARLVENREENGNEEKLNDGD